ncbi:MAG: CBS domain-containing protein, partial [Desulfovibrio sp.]|nr:CBS domain-containing protein [Desulfovibrio sp.]
MLVRDWMTRNVTTLGLKTTVVDAAEIMRKK